MKSSVGLKLLILFQALLDLVSPENILVWNAIGTHSTRISQWPLMESLAEKGHNVSFLTAIKPPEAIPLTSKVNFILPKKLNEGMGSSWEDHVNFFKIRGSLFGIPISWYDIREFGVHGCELLYSDEEFLSWATAPSTKVDLVIVEISVNECAYGFIHLWQAKMIVYSTTTAMTWFYDVHGLPDESSSISDFVLGYPSFAQNQMNFWQRFVNGISPIVYTLTRDLFYLPKMEEMARKGLRLKEIPSFREIERNTSLVILTQHFSYETPRSLPPNVIAVGGAAISEQNKKQLPKEMEDFIGKSGKGFIYISFGTVTDFLHFSLQIQIEFISALKAFPDIKFIWKSGREINATKLPDNVLVTKWAPQQTLLAHPKILAFITHSGMGSTTEAIHFSVPLICIPIMMEQDHNANTIVERGAGIKLEILTLHRSQLETAISEILQNTKYREGMTKLTKIFKDRPRPPLEEAIWWLEYTLRHDNIHEILTPLSAHQSWWKKRQLDVWITASSLIAFTLILSLILITKLFKIICSSRSSKPQGKTRAKLE